MTTAEHQETLKHVAQAMQTTMDVALAIREAGSLPEGELQAVLMPVLSPETFQKILLLLLRDGLIKRENNRIVWTGGF